jgi:hypothetical protein
VITEHESNCDSYDDKVKDIYVDGSGSDTSTSKVESKDSDLDSSVDIKAV